MELRQLRHLLALAETASFSRAAARLHLTQSALSRSIQTLESELGAPLLDRIGKRNELTPMGQTVVAHAQRVLHDVDNLDDAIRQLREGRMTSLRLGLGSGPGALLMTPLLQYMANHHPGVQTKVSRGATDLQLLQLRNRELDALVIDARRIQPAHDLHLEHLAELRADFICRKDHPLARRRRVPFAELLSFPIASTPLSDEVARHLVTRYGPAAHPSEMVTLHCEEITSLIDTVRESDAIFLGIRAAAREALARGAFVALPVHPALDASARFALVTRTGRTESASLAFLRQFVAQHLQE